MPNYNNGKVYMILSPSHPDEIYIGSTTQPLAKRIGDHRLKYKQYQNGKYHYQTSFKILEYDDAKIELLEDCKCERREQLLAREGHYIRTMNCVNKRIEGRTMKEWCEANKDKIYQRQKQYRQNNKDKVSQYQKQYRQKNRDEILQKKKQYQQKNRDKIAQRQRQYRESNRDEIAQRSKQYRERNKERLAQKDKQKYQKNKAKLSEKITCECGAVMNRSSLSTHKKTSKHLQALKTTEHLTT